MSITLDHLSHICTRPGGVERAAMFVEPLNRWLDRFGMATQARAAAFLAQVLHESAEFSALREYTNYSSPDRLFETFHHHFGSVAEASHFIGKPQAIANRVYAGRNGNGDEASGDGWRYRGGGLIQTTGRANYAAAGHALGLDLVGHSELIEQPEAATGTACYFWSTHHLNELADQGAFTAITKIINGGLNGEADREMYWARAKTALGVA